MKLSRGGVIVLAQVEACVLVPYRDGAHNSIFFGHNGPDANTLQPRTVAKAFEVLEADLRPREERVLKLLKTLPTQQQFDALVILHYQSGNRYLPVVTHLINYKELGLLEDIWPLLAYSADGKKMNGLKMRREREAAIFFEGDYGDIGAPIKLWHDNPRATQWVAYSLKDEDLAGVS